MFAGGQVGGGVGHLAVGGGVAGVEGAEDGDGLEARGGVGRGVPTTFIHRTQYQV